MSPEKNKRELLAKLLQKKLNAKSGEKTEKKYPDDIIAIVGMSGRYPMADDIDMFWENLVAGRDCVTDIPQTRWNWQEFKWGTAADSARTQGGFIADVDKFDPQFFGISPREAVTMDPQERLFLQTAWHTVEDAGYTPKTLANNSGKVGVFVGVMNSNYSILGSTLWNQAHKTDQTYICNPTFWSLANRVSYTFNFNGPSLAIDTACSSSLTAIHLACESIRRNECEMALAGGVNLILHPAQMEILAKREMLSPTGKCHSFGQGADGFADGEGVGAILLKPLNQAVQDGDNIYGVIRGSHLNSGGKTNGYSVPSPVAQANLIATTIKNAKVDPRKITYVEAHGTGTALGDPIEVRGLAKAFGSHTEDKQYCALGSVKANIGHLEAAAGISGITKILLQMRHETLVPTIHATQESEYIDLKNSPFYLQKEISPWLPGKKKLAGISSFGAGGSNTHIILQSFNLPEQQHGDMPCVIPVSVTHKHQLPDYIQSLIAQIEKNKTAKHFSLVNVSHTLIEGRQDMAVRLAVVASNIDELLSKLRSYLQGNKNIENLFEGFADTNDAKQYHVFKSLQQSELIQFAKKWVSGEVKKPQALFKNFQPQRISLPGYPFLKESYWAPRSPAEVVGNESDSKLVKSSAIPVASTTITSASPRIGNLYLTPAWINKAAKGSAAQTDLSNVLIFSQDENCHPLFEHKFKQVSFVKLGSSFSNDGKNNYTVRQDHKEDMELLLNTAGGLRPVDAIIYAWKNSAIEANEQTGAVESLYAGIQPLLSLVKNLASNNKNAAIKIVIWSVDNGCLSDLSSLAYSGFVKSVKAEQQELDIKHVIFEKNEEHSLEFQLAALTTELMEPASAPAVIKYCEQQRKIESIQSVELADTTALHSWIKQGGTYLITGGLGGLGKVFAKRIAAIGGVKLALTGRSALSESNKSFLETLRAKNNEVVYYSCDLTSEADVHVLFEKITSRFIKLDGIIHSAGVIKDCLINRKNWPDFKAVIDTKIKGVFNLDQESAAMPLDFFVAFSSVSSVLGNIGQTDYAFGNAYLDELCRWRNNLKEKNLRSGKSISINWPIWEDGGMKIEKNILRAMEESVGIIPLAENQGLDMFDDIMQSSLTQVMPLHGVLNRLETTMQRYNAHGESALPGSPIGAEAQSKSTSDSILVNAAETANQLAQPLDEKLREMISKAIQLPKERIDPNRVFGDMGFDSIVLREFAANFKTKLDIELSPAVFFSSNTLNKIKQYLLTDHLSSLQKTLVPSGVVANNIGSQEKMIATPVRQLAQAQSAHQQPVPHSHNEPVAIIGMDGMFPGAENLDVFWQNLSEGVDPISEIPPMRWRWQDHYGSTFGAANKTNSKWGGFMPHIEYFDHHFFDLSAGEAIHMDPQQRLFLQTVWKTIESAGYNAMDLKGNNVGVFVGVEFSDYKDYLDRNGVRYSAEMAIGNSLNMIPNRVSYYFDFDGPSEAVDTACSGSLVAINRAIRSIQSGESRLAIAGGVSVILSPKTMIGTSQLNIYSPDGRCKTFDKSANGYVKGEGVAAVLLKPLKAAIEDGDNILAVIKGAAVNHGGRSNSITAPNPAAQAKLLFKAYSEAGIGAERVSYIELHGTGTNLGDPVEVEGIKSAFAMLAESAGTPVSKNNYCGIGSVKSNIGHLEPAAGIAGVIKVILSMKARQLPPNLHFTDLNPLIKIENSPFYVVDKKRDWVRNLDSDGNELPLVAGVSSFGFGGTNAHLVLEEYLAPRQASIAQSSYLFVLSAKTSAQLDESARNLIAYVDSSAREAISLRDFIYTLQVGRVPMEERLAFTVSHWQDLGEKLRDYLAGRLDYVDCRGSKASNHIPVHDLLDDSLQGYILQSGNNRQLAKWWLLGVNFNWQLLYTNAPSNKINLPTYPFAKTRCWIDSVVGEAQIIEQPAASVPAPVSEPIAATQSVSAIPALVREKVSQLAGVSFSELADDAHLAADIGLDSIKMMSLINELISSRPEAELEYFNELGMNSIVGQAQTISGLIDIFTRAEASVSSSNVSAQTPPTTSTQGVIMVDDGVPLLDSQYLFLPTYFITNSSSLCSYVELKGPLDINLANAAWSKLIQRHPVLQLGFQWPGKKSATFADVKVDFVRDYLAPKIRCEDIRALSDKSAAIQQAFDERLNRQWNMEQWPLHEFALYQKADDEYVLFWSNEHIISDGLSNQQALREFLELYTAELSGVVIPAAEYSSAEQYVELIKRINSYTESESVADIPQALSGSYTFNPEGKIRDRSNVKFECAKHVLDSAFTDKLFELTKRSRFSMNTILVNAFIQAIAQYDKTGQDITLQIPTGGRNYPDLSLTNTMGCFAQNLSISFSRTNIGDQQSGFDLVQNTINDSILYGVDIKQARDLTALVKQMPLTEQNALPKHAADMMLAAVKSNLYFPYTGHTGIASCYGNVQVQQYTAGTSNSPGSIDLLQEIFDGRLHIFVNYDASFFPSTLIDSLVKDYIGKLESFTAQNFILTSGAHLNVVDSQLQTDVVLDHANRVLNASLTLGDVNKDLEADLGFDSIDKIKLVTQLYTWNKTINRSALIKCRSLGEMAAAIQHGSVTGSAQTAIALTSSNTAATTEAHVSFDDSILTPIERIINQAQATPDAIAVTNQQGQSITYRELDIQSSKIARVLKAQGIGTADFVGVISNRGPLMLVGILAILKSGAAYVPIDPTYPAGRMSYILKHARIKTLVADPSLIGVLDDLFPADKENRTEGTLLESIVLLGNANQQQSESFGKIVSDVVTTASWGSLSGERLELSINPQDNMVVLFTSGSTGNPKGVVLNHEGYNNRLNWHQKLFQLCPGEKVAQKTSCCFDVSLWELFWPLMFGGVVCAVEKDTVSNPWDFADWLEAESINIAHFVPSMFGAFISNIDTEKHQFKSLRWLAFSGEALATNTVQQWIDAYQLTVGLCNLYGPTEASIDVTYHIISERPGDAVPIPIGKAIDNVSLIILDQEGNQVKPGEMGELCIGGIQVAKEYLYEPQLTAKAFISNKFAAIPGATLYRTGDLATENEDGSFNYHGRIDSQVKIRGFRVELGEIENIASSHTNINEAAVLLVNQGGTDKLIMWYAGAQTPEAEIKAFINERCPDYMVPHFVYWSDVALPKNSNGKLDRKVLLNQLQAGTEKKIESKTTTPTVDKVLPVGPAQKWIFSYFDEPYKWYGISQLHYRKALDIDCFQSAVNILVENHAELRTVFGQKDGSWVQEVHTNCPVLEVIHHHSTLSGDELAESIQELAYAMADSLHYNQWPLCKFAVIKLQDDSCKILWVAHHLMSDLVSGQLLSRQLWAVYSSLVSNSTYDQSLFVSSTSYPGYVEELQAAFSTESSEYKNLLNYWKKQAAGIKKCIEIPYDQHGGDNTEDSDARIVIALEKDAVGLLQRNACELYECNFYSLLCAPVYKLMANLLKRTQIAISHKLNARNIGGPAKNYFSCVGNFAVNAPLNISVKKQDGFSVIINAIKSGLADMPMGGASYDWVSDALPEDMYPDSKLTSIRINYLGDITAIESEDFYVNEKELNQRLSFPLQKRTSLVEFFFYTKNKVTYLEISYSDNFYAMKTMEGIGAQYQEILSELVHEVKRSSAVTSD